MSSGNTMTLGMAVFNTSSQKQLTYIIRKLPQKSHFYEISLHKYFWLVKDTCVCLTKSMWQWSKK